MRSQVRELVDSNSVSAWLGAVGINEVDSLLEDGISVVDFIVFVGFSVLLDEAVPLTHIVGLGTKSSS
jgi:hypothetical protein